MVVTTRSMTKALALAKIEQETIVQECKPKNSCKSVGHKSNNFFKVDMPAHKPDDNIKSYVAFIRHAREQYNVHKVNMIAQTPWTSEERQLAGAKISLMLDNYNNVKWMKTRQEGEIMVLEILKYIFLESPCPLTLSASFYEVTRLKLHEFFGNNFIDESLARQFWAIAYGVEIPFRSIKISCGMWLISEFHKSEILAYCEKYGLLSTNELVCTKSLLPLPKVACEQVLCLGDDTSKENSSKSVCDNTQMKNVHQIQDEIVQEAKGVEAEMENGEIISL